MSEAESPTPLTAFEVRGEIQGLKTDLMQLEDRLCRCLDASNARITAHELAIENLCRRLDKLDVSMKQTPRETWAAASDKRDELAVLDERIDAVEDSLSSITDGRD